MATISIITICFNNLPELIETCRSVEAQRQHPEEHLIIDGSTNKDIVNWLANNEQPRYRKWIHERDKGIADAFNKGIVNCSGEIIHILNSGDQYYTVNALEIVKNAFNIDPALTWTHSQYVQHRGNVDVVSGAAFEKNKLWKGMRTVAHPTMFIKKELYDKHGLYDLQYKIAMDYDFLVRIRNEKFQFIREPLVYFAPGGASNLQFEQGLREVKRSHNTHIGRSARLLLWQIRQRVLHLFMQTTVGKLWFQAKNRRHIR